MRRDLEKWFNTILLAISFVLTVVLIISTQTEPTEEIIEGGISNQLYRADFEMENEIETERLRQQAKDAVGDVYKENLTIEVSIFEEIDELFEEIGLLRQAEIPLKIPYTDDEDETENEEEEGLEEEDEELVYDIESKTELTDKQIEALVTMPSEDFVHIKDIIYQVTQEEFETGIKDENLSKILVSLKDDLDKTDLEPAEVTIAYRIISDYLEPNMFVDAEATADAKEKASEEVEPVKILKGQKIVNVGEKITPEIYSILEAYGYVGGGAEKTIIPLVGRIVMAILVFIMTIFYLQNFHKKEVLADQKKMLVLFTFYVVAVIFARILASQHFLFLPVIIFTMLVAILLDERLGIMFSTIITLACGVIIEGEMAYYVYFMMVGPVSALLAKRMVERDQVFSVSAMISLINMVTIYALELITKRALWTADTSGYLLIAFGSGLLSVVLVMGTTPYWESIFGIVSENKLLDLSNPKNPLIRRMIIEAPGTYHHSLIVANLAETASFDIGADSTLARVGGYYHDIGKMQYPGYFTENQAGENPHDYLSPQASAKIIIGHLENGERMAREHKLPEVIIDMITQHHGNTLVKYFYFQALEEAGDGPKPREEDFRYPYEPPSFRESAVLMLADTVEAAIRSMIPQGKSMEEVSKRVAELIKDKLDDGQLMNSGLTIKDLDTIHGSFMRVFKGMYHQRVPYPKGLTKDLVPKDDVEEDVEDENEIEEKEESAKEKETEEKKKEKDSDDLEKETEEDKE